MFVLFPHYRCVFASFIFILFVHVLSSYPTSLILFPLCRFIYWFGGSNSVPFLNLIYRSLNTEVIRGASEWYTSLTPCIIYRLIHGHFHIGLRRSRGPYWPGPIWASIWKWSCSNPITGYFPGVWTYGQFTSGHIGHTKMPLFELCNKSIYSEILTKLNSIKDARF